MISCVPSVLDTARINIFHDFFRRVWQNERHPLPQFLSLRDTPCHRVTHALLRAVKWSKRSWISKSSRYRISKEDLELYLYKTTVEPEVTDEHKNRTKKFAKSDFHHFQMKNSSISTAYTTSTIRVLRRSVLLK